MFVLNNTRVLTSVRTYLKKQKNKYYYWVVYVTTGDGLKSQNGQFKGFEFINFRAHKK